MLHLAQMLHHPTIVNMDIRSISHQPPVPPPHPSVCNPPASHSLVQRRQSVRSYI